MGATIISSVPLFMRDALVIKTVMIDWERRNNMRISYDEQEDILFTIVTPPPCSSRVGGFCLAVS